MQKNIHKYTCRININIYKYTRHKYTCRKREKNIRNSISSKRNGCKTAQCLIKETLVKMVNFPTSFSVGCFHGHVFCM